MAIKPANQGGEMRKRKGFTLIELIVVIIIIGILAAVAIPQYLRATERAKVAKAKNALSLIAQAEKMYRAEKDTYMAPADFFNNATTGLGGYLELSQVDNDYNDWLYSVTNVGTDTFTAVAKRNSGSQNGATITLDQDGTWNGTFPVEYGGIQQ